MIDLVVTVLQWGVLAYFVLVNGLLTLLLVSAALEMRAHRLEVWRENRWRILSSEVAPSISILAPAHNEAVTVSESVQSLLTLRYPSLEVVLVNDGSADDTLAVLERDFDLVRVHAAPLRRRLHAAPIRGVYRSRSTPAFGNLIVSGAFGLFRREPMIAAGGYLHETVGEDMEIVVRMRRFARRRGEPARAAFIPDPVAWTEVPSRVRVLARQRDRWHRGLADVLVRHRGMLLNPRYGAMGLVSMPYFLVVELLAPVVELAGLAGVVAGLLLDAVDLRFALMFLLLAYGYGMALTAWTLVLDELTYRGYGGLGDRLWLLGVGLLEGLGYRQATAVWRLRGLWRFLRGRRDWGVMTREGFARRLPSASE
jgi:cellulose synthase/poly-beta-1,6-N-acetylglucosamine synthase-like glycosyltransferase